MSVYENQNHDKEKKWDVIVIGAGMAGMLTAYYLQKEGLDVLVLEAKKAASGQTGRTTAKITSQHGLKYSTLIRTVGSEKARIYAQANQEAIDEYEKLIKKEHIDCDFRRCPAYLYTKMNESAVKDEIEAARELGIKAAPAENTELPFETVAAARFDEQACFDANKFAEYLAGRLNILENTQVVKVRGNKAYTRDRVFSAEDIVIATHYPVKNIPGFYFLRQHQERSYVLALETCPKMEGMYYGIDEDGISMRQEGRFLLFGGGSHRTGKAPENNIYEKLEAEARKYYPQCRVAGKWSAQDCMPHDGIPFIGRFSSLTPDIYVATGFQKWGMTSSMVAALILRDEICGRHSQWLETFKPQRMNVRAGLKNLLVDVGESVKGLSAGIFGRPKCSHMGCRLHWNMTERAWECPCHGSRFDENGRVKDNPAVDETVIK